MIHILDHDTEATELVTVSVSKKVEHRQTTTSIGTVLALRSITLRNEVPGTVRQVMLAPGQIVDAGTVLVGLDVSVEQAELRALQAQATLAQQVAAGLRAGDSVEVFVASDLRSTEAKIVAVDARVEPATRSAMVRAKIERAAPAPGASVRVRVPVGAPHSAIAVSASALRKGPGGDHVFVLIPDKQGKTRAHVRPVQVGAMLGDEVVILNGLSAGEQLAASGSFKLREAMLVTIASDPSADASRTK